MSGAAEQSWTLHVDVPLAAATPEERAGHVARLRHHLGVTLRANRCGEMMEEWDDEGGRVRLWVSASLPGRACQAVVNLFAACNQLDGVAVTLVVSTDREWLGKLVLWPRSAATAGFSHA